MKVSGRLWSDHSVGPNVGERKAKESSPRKVGHWCKRKENIYTLEANIQPLENIDFSTLVEGATNAIDYHPIHLLQGWAYR